MAKAEFMADTALTYGANSLDLFVDRLKEFPSPVVLDLGPLSERNLNYLAGENRFAVRVEDLSREDGNDLARAAARMVLKKKRYHGVLLWSLLDHFDREAFRDLVVRLWSALVPGGLVVVFFGQRRMPRAAVQRFTIQGKGMISIEETGVRAPCRNWPNREIMTLFEPFDTVNSFILKSGLREFLFRRPRSMTWDLNDRNSRGGGE